MTQKYIHNYNQQLTVSNLSGLTQEEKTWLRNLGEFDRFKFYIGPSFTETSIPDDAFNLNNMEEDIAEIIYPKCYEITIENNNIQIIGNNSFRGRSGWRFTCLESININCSNLISIGDYAFADIYSRCHDILDLSSCTKLKTLNSYCFAYQNFYGLNFDYSVDLKEGCFSTTENLDLVFTQDQLQSRFTDTPSAFTGRHLYLDNNLYYNFNFHDLQKETRRIHNKSLYIIVGISAKMYYAFLHYDPSKTYYINVLYNGTDYIKDNILIQYKALNLQDKYKCGVSSDFKLDITLRDNKSSLKAIEAQAFNLLQNDHQILNIKNLGALEEVGENAVQFQPDYRSNTLNLLSAFNLRILKANAIQIYIKSTDPQTSTVMLPYNIETFYNNSITSYNTISLNLFPCNKYQSIMSTNSKFSSITNILEGKDPTIIGESNDFNVLPYYIDYQPTLSSFSDQALCKMYQNIYDINNQAYFKIIPKSSEVTRVTLDSIGFNIKHCTQIDLRNLTSLKEVKIGFQKIFYYNYDDDPSQYTNELFKFPDSLETIEADVFKDNCFYHTKTPIIDLSNTKVNTIETGAFVFLAHAESNFDASSQSWIIKLPSSTAATITIQNNSFNNCNQETSLILSPYNILKSNPKIDFSKTGSFYFFNIETNLSDNDILLDNTKLNIIGLTEKGIMKQSVIENDTSSSVRPVYCPSSALSQVTTVQNLGLNSNLNYIVDLRNLTSLNTINGDGFTASKKQTLVSLGTDVNTIEFTTQIQTPIYLWYPQIQYKTFSNSNINLAIFSPSNTLFVDFVINTNCSQNFGDTILCEGTNASSCAQFTETQLAVIKEKCIKIEFSQNSEITTIPQELFNGLDRVTKIYDKSEKITTLGNNCFATTQSVDTQVTGNLANNANASSAFTNRNLTIISFITIPNYISKFSEFSLDSNKNLIRYTVPDYISYERIYITLPQCNYTNQSYTFNDLSNIAYFDMSNVQNIQADATQNILTNQNILDCIILNGNITSSLKLANLNTQKETTTFVYIKNASTTTNLETLSSTLINKSQSFVNNTYSLKYYDKRYNNCEINIKERQLFNDIINWHPVIFNHCYFIVKDTESKQYLVNRNKCSNCKVTFITEYEEQ